MPIETVQDIVQEELVLGGHMRVAERYIVYRAERAMLRARDAAATPATSAGDPGGRGRRARGRVDRRGPARRIAFASIGLDLPLDADELERELRRSVRAGHRPATTCSGSSCSTPRR